MKKKNGYFITLEGPEGSGKSSQSKQIVRALRREGFKVVVIRDPGSTQLGRSIRNVLLHSSRTMSSLQEALLFIGGRVQLVNDRIRPAIERGEIVVCDRFHYATIAYQGFGSQLDVKWLDELGRKAIDGFMPQLTILLDLPVERGFSRLNRSLDRMEEKGRAYHKRVRAGYKRLAKNNKNRIVLVNAAQTVDKVARKINDIVFAHLKRAGLYK